MTAEFAPPVCDIPGLRREFVTIDDDRWVHSHASTLVMTRGEMLVAWFAGTSEGADDTGIWLSRRSAHAAWAQPERVDEVGPGPHWNPVLAIAPDGVLWLFFKRGRRISAWQTFVRTSRDEGHTWSPARELVPGDLGGRGPAKNPPIVVGGRWFAPGSVETWPASDGEEARWDAFIDISDDSGATWQRNELPLNHARYRRAGAIQPALWRNDRGGITALCRSAEGRALRSVSVDVADAGRLAFSELVAVGLPNNNSGLDAVAVHAGGRSVVIAAHNAAGGDWASRSTLVLSASSDDGRSWVRVGCVDGLVDTMRPGSDAVSADVGSGEGGASANSAGRPRGASDRGVDTDGTDEYSYPTMIVDGELLRITYTWQRRGIAIATVPIAGVLTVVAGGTHNC